MDAKLGHLAMPYPFFKNHHLHHLFQKEKKRLTKSGFFKIMHLFSKLGAFGHALSYFFETNQVNHCFSKKIKEKRETSFQKKIIIHKFSYLGHSAEPHLDEYKSH